MQAGGKGGDADRMTRQGRGRPAVAARRRSVLLSGSAMLLLASGAAHAADWLGTTSPDWFAAGNWAPAAVPGAATDVAIDNGGAPNPATINAAGAVARKVTLGSGAGQSGTLNVAGGALSGVTTLTVGDYGSGTVAISGGGTLGANTVYLAVDPGGSGTATVSGSGSKLTTNSLYAGMDAGASAHVTVQDGAQLSATLTVLGYYDATAAGTLTVTGGTAGTGSLTVGERGKGTFTLNGGATGTSGSVTLGSNATGTGIVNVSGSGTTWATGTLTVGTTGAGTLTISDGAKVTSTQNNTLIAPAFIGDSATVTGTGSKWTITGNPAGMSQAVLVIGSKAGATGSLTVADGGKAEIAATASGTNGNFQQIRMGLSAGSTGVLKVTGAGSSFTTPYDILAGYNPGTTARIVVEQGGALNTGYTIVGSAGTGIAEVTGAGSVWTILDTPNVPSDYPHGLQIASGPTSVGSLTIADGGVVNVNAAGRTVVLGGFAGSKAALNIGGDALGPAAAPGTLNADKVVFVTGADSTINFNHTSGSYVFAAALQGAGPGKVNFLSGKTILTGYNTYAGTTTIAAGGTAQLGNGGSDGMISGNIVDNGALVFDVSSFPLYSGVISGSGTVEQRGTGTVTLAADNSYTGRTTISAGTLRVGNGGTTGTISNDVLDNSILMFDRSDNFAYNGAIAGTGELVKAGAGVMTLGGAGTFTGGTSVQKGTLRLGGNDRLAATGSLFLFSTGTFDLGGFTQTVGDLSGPGTVAIGTGSFTAGTAGNRTFAGRFTGSGAFVKQGAGSLTLTGNSAAYAGTTTVAAGTLVANGDLSASAVTVKAGATLGGTGTVGTTTVAGTVAPGLPGAVGTLAVEGAYTQASGSVYAVDIDPSTSDRIDVAGDAAIEAGTTVRVSGAGGAYVIGKRYTILSATGSVSGQYSALTSNLPFLGLELAYDPGNVFLDVTRSDTAFQDVGRTPNQIAAGGGVESLGPGSPVYDAVLNLSAAQARHAFDQLSGEIHASARTALIEDSRFIRDAVDDRIRAAFDGADGLAAWGRAFGSWGHWDSDGNAARLERSIGGFFAGADAPVVEGWRLGAVAGYSHAGLDVGDRHSSGSRDDYHVGLYGGGAWGSLALRAGAAYSWHDVSTSRNVVFAGFADRLKGDYDAGTAQVFGEVAYGFDAGGARFEPYAGIAYVNLHTDGFREKGGEGALAGRSGDTEATFTTLGLRASTAFDLAGTAARARGTIGWRHAFGDVTPDVTMRFARGGDTFPIAGVPIARDAAVLEAGLDFALAPAASLGLSYAGQFGAGSADHSVKASLDVRF